MGIKMLQIGNIKLESNVILAPMSGVTDVPFRKLVKRYGAGLVISEMIASAAMIRNTRQSLQMCKGSDSPWAVQLAGCDPEIMAEAAKLNEDMGAQIIDINMGCPVKKIVNGYAGSALMKDEIHAAKIIKATVDAVKIPVTLKMRTGWDENNKNAPKLASIAESLGIQMITIHGRTRSQMYNGKADWSFIKNVKNSVKIPVIGNGDVVSEEDAVNLLNDSTADGVMIGRGTYGKPWFVNQVDYFLKNKKKLEPPSLSEIYSLALEHIEMIREFYGDHTALGLAKKPVAWYSKDIENSAKFRLSISTSDSIESIVSLTKEFFVSNM
jgi:tRNA-dihydrouridine synthase B